VDEHVIQRLGDDDLLTWEAYPSSGHYGLATEPRIVFQCITDPSRPPRYVVRPGDEADAESEVIKDDEKMLREMLRNSKPIE
jgi:hypothetical protein